MSQCLNHNFHAALGEQEQSPKPLEPARLQVISIESGKDDAKVRVDYEADPRIYDSGKLLVVEFRRNEKDLDAVENLILDSEDRDDATLDALDDVLPNIVKFYKTMTRITLETIDGKLTVTVTEAIDEVNSYLPIPPHLSHISTVPITELEKIRFLDMDVDRVKWKAVTYAFKQTGESFQGTLQELTILDKLANVPSIISLEAIVVNHNNTIRGFLTPFMPAGNLERLFRRVREAQGLAYDAEATVFDWPLKLSWARQISQAVVELHAIAAYNGDLKPQNVLINPAGEAVLIDFLPIGISEDSTAPEVLAKWHDHEYKFESSLTAPSDVYSLGLLLWAIAEEKWKGVRPPVWRIGKTPVWYINLVRNCLAPDPETRPTIIDVVSLLEKGGF